MKLMSIQNCYFMHEITKIDDVHVRVYSRVLRDLLHGEFAIHTNDGYIADYRELETMLGNAYPALVEWMKGE